MLLLYLIKYHIIFIYKFYQIILYNLIEFVGICHINDSITFTLPICLSISNCLYPGQHILHILFDFDRFQSDSSSPTGKLCTCYSKNKMVTNVNTIKDLLDNEIIRWIAVGNKTLTRPQLSIPPDVQRGGGSH